MNQYSKRLNTIHKNYIYPILSEHGFKKEKWLYVKELKTHNLLIETQAGKISSERDYQFTINIGEFVPNLIGIYSNLPEPKKPKVAHCACSARIGMLAEEKRDIWWELNKDIFISGLFF